MPNIPEKEFKKRLLKIDSLINSGYSAKFAFEECGFFKTEEEIREESEEINLASRLLSKAVNE